MKKINYKEYLESDEWKEKRRRARKSAHNKCLACGLEKQLQVHHGTYRRLGREKLKDLFCLCKWCHEETHQLQKEYLERNGWRRDYLWKLTKRYIKKTKKESL